MPHLNLNAGDHDITGSCFVVRMDGLEPRAVVHEHKKLKILLQFGGHVEHHEHPWSAALHELTEESGYELDQLKVLQPRQRMQAQSGATVLPVPVSFITHQFDNPLHQKEHHHDDLGFALVTPEPPRQKPQAGESTVIRYLTKKDLLATPESRLPGDVRQTFIFIMDYCLKHWESLDINDFVT